MEQRIQVGRFPAGKRLYRKQIHRIQGRQTIKRVVAAGSVWFLAGEAAHDGRSTAQSGMSVWERGGLTKVSQLFKMEIWNSYYILGGRTLWERDNSLTRRHKTALHSFRLSLSCSGGDIGESLGCANATLRMLLTSGRISFCTAWQNVRKGLNQFHNRTSRCSPVCITYGM